MNTESERSGLQEIIDIAIEEMRAEAGAGFDIDKINLAELARKTGLTRAKLRTLKSKGFKVTPHAKTGTKAKSTVMSGFGDVADDLLMRGVTNSEVIFCRLVDAGYAGSKTTVKNYIKDHKALVPAQRKLLAPQGSRGCRFTTKPGEMYQMDWGFVNAEDEYGGISRLACFVMNCHHCGTCYIEFFPNAKQENLFIGMIHCFLVMGIPEYVLTDNMKSVVTRRDMSGSPIWQTDYEAFMRCLGFKTRLCKPYHPFTKGKVERLVRFVKENFLVGCSFVNLNDLNTQARQWCSYQSNRYRQALNCVPAEEHANKCLLYAQKVEVDSTIGMYLCPLRKISFDGFVSYEGRRFGVPYWYSSKACRVNREGSFLHIYSEDLERELAVHPVTWSRKDSFCADQYEEVQPYELPSTPIRTTILAQNTLQTPDAFAKFDFERRFV